MVPEGIPEDQIILRAFPFSLLGNAKDWLYYMPAGSFSTWIALHKSFLEKFFLHLVLDLLGKKYVELNK